MIGWRHLPDELSAGDRWRRGDRDDGPATPGPPSMTGYHAGHLTADPSRVVVWQVIADHLSSWIPPGGRVLEIGAGYCRLDQRRAGGPAGCGRRVARGAAHSRPRASSRECSMRRRICVARRPVRSTWCSPRMSSSTSRRTRRRRWVLTFTLLRPGGRFIVIQPNFRYAFRRYFDDYTHRSVFTHVSLPALLRSRGFAHRAGRRRASCPTRCRTLVSRFAAWLVRAYLRSPIKPMAGPDADRGEEGLTVVYGAKTVSVVLPAYNEEQYIRAAGRGFRRRRASSTRVIVVDNNSRDRTDEEAARTSARVVHETAQGYGHALRRGLREATGDLDHHGGAGRHVRRPRRAEAARVCRRLRHGLRHADDARAGLGAGQHGLVPARRQLGGRQDDPGRSTTGRR